MKVIAVLPQGFEEIGSQELAAFGAREITILRRAIAFEADMACLYRLHLNARLPFRFLREIACFPCQGPDSLYRGIQRAFDWVRWLKPSMSFRVDVSGRSDGLSHSHFSALTVKNALVDLQRQEWGKRSLIDLDAPDLSIHVHLRPSEAVLSFDGSKGSLHRRGYRAAMGIAPLKENLAAGLICLSNWDSNAPLVDPLCGSGSLLIEAASIALGFAPGLNRSFLLEKWADFDSHLWASEKTRAASFEKQDNPKLKIIGCEQDSEIAEMAKSNVLSAGLEEVISIQTCNFNELDLPNQPGWVVSNPPYGKRLGCNQELTDLYEELGKYLKNNASGWQLWLLSGNADLTKALRMKCSRKIPIQNGGIDCRFLNYAIH